MRLIFTFVLILAFTGCRARTPRVENPQAAATATPKTIRDFQTAAEAHQAIISVPQMEKTPTAVAESMAKTIAQANAALDRLGKLEASEVSFQNTVLSLDDIAFEANLGANRLSLLKETSPQSSVRDAATDAIKQFEEWAVGLDYREDVYRAVRAFADTQPTLSEEDSRLLAETLRDYRRAGLQLPMEQRAEVERLRKELSVVSTDFDSNVTKAQKVVTFSKAALTGVPDSFLDQPGVKTGEDEYSVQAHVTWHYTTVMDNAAREETRQRLLLARENLAREENVPLLKKILKLRAQIAQLLGYKTWADFKIEPMMAKNAATAIDFLHKLKEGLEPKFKAELEQFRQLKATETGNPQVALHLWDIRYFSNQLKKQKFDIDTEKLRAFFPYEKTLRGMFDIYQQIFGLRITELEAKDPWVPELKLYGVLDAVTDEPLGLFYLDMFPREGKYSHFAQFGIIDGKRLRDGKYQRPTVALICNFPAPSPDKPSLLTHSDVETLFHEFGHALHSILTRANHLRFSGTSVPRDFVEAPSQMLENWVWDKNVLDRFAEHYEHPGEKIPKKILDQLKAAKLATIASFYRRQLSFGLLDLALHTQVKDDTDLVPFSNRILSEVYMPVPDDTAMIAYFGHLTGYDAAYYGYAWADAIAADMATVFERAPNGYFDVTAGGRLRDEVYAPGDSRDVNVSIRRFLGRPQSIAPFLKTLGMEGVTP